MNINTLISTLLVTHQTVNSFTVKAAPVCQVKPVAAVKVDLGEQIIDFFRNLFNTADFPARWYCGNWSNFHGWLYIFSDVLIWASYFAFPLIIFTVVKRRKDLPFQKIFIWIGAFIILCGTTHLIDAIIFWWPIYRFSALLRFFTGVVSACTVYTIYKTLPQIMLLRTVEGLKQEITERKIIEEKLSASEFLLSEAGRMATVGGFELDIDTDIATWSKAVYDIYDLPYGEQVHLAEAMLVYAQPYKQMLEDALAKLYIDGSTLDMELLLITKLGNTKWVRCYAEPKYDKTGTLIKLRGVLMDIGKYKSSELNLNRSLELLSTQNQQLKSFTHILSHNIRNHSSNISMLINFLEPELLDANNADIFNKIAMVSAGLDQTLNDLSAAIKIRESVLVAETQNFSAVTAGVVDILQTDIKVNDVSFDMDFEVETVLFPGIYLESIIMNLISNGIKYRKPNEAPLICLRTYLDDQGKKVMECIDNGLGIDLNMHGNKVFGLYKTFTDHKDAHGVGLFLVKNQVESQGGTIEVFSQAGIGTTFKITFNE